MIVGADAIAAFETAGGNVVLMPDRADGRLVYATPLVTPGTYHLAFLRHVTVFQFRSYKLALHFRIVDLGPAFGADLCRYYAVRKVASGRRIGGRFEYGQKSDFFREYCRVFGAPVRPDRISPAAYRNTVIVGEVATVMKGHDNQELPDGARYSKVARLIRLEAGGG